jgi:hypothetical protein
MDARLRRHFDSIAQAMREDELARADEAMAMDAWERMKLGLRLASAAPLDEATEAELDRRALGQAELHLKWRRLQRRRTQG